MSTLSHHTVEVGDVIQIDDIELTILEISDGELLLRIEAPANTPLVADPPDQTCSLSPGPIERAAGRKI